MQNVLFLYFSPFSFYIYPSIIYYTTTAVSSSPSCPPCPSPIPPFFAISTSSFLSEKGKSQKYQPAMTQQVNDKTRHTSHNKDRQSNSAGEKGTQNQAKDQSQTLRPTVRISTGTQRYTAVTYIQRT